MRNKERDSERQTLPRTIFYYIIILYGSEDGLRISASEVRSFRGNARRRRRPVALAAITHNYFTYITNVIWYTYNRIIISRNHTYGYQIFYNHDPDEHYII